MVDPGVRAPATPTYGLVVPHFGAYASRRNLLDGALAAEAYGFDSLWVRDHLLYAPAKHEDPDATHLETFVTLSAIAAVTERISLGTATLIPHRHPVLSAMMLGSLDAIAGPGRIIAGWGIGSHDREFGIVGMEGWDRREVLSEQVQIIRQLLSGEPLSFEGRYYKLDNIQLRPVPGMGRSIPMWYGGASVAAVRRAVAGFDGWIGARIPRRDLRARVQRMGELSEAAGREPPEVGVIPYVSPARDRQEAMRSIDLAALLADTARRYKPPLNRTFETVDDLDGAVIAGPAQEIIEGVRRYQAAGAQHVVLDMRLRFERWLQAVQLVGEQVLPDLRRGDIRDPS